MISHHDALYRAICIQPDEDTPRLAYADLIEEEGDETRAHFIRAQIALARVPEYDSLVIATRQGEPDVIHAWGMAHALPRMPAGYDWRTFAFRRGFPWMVRVVSPEAFGGDGAAAFDAAPVQALAIDALNRSALADLAVWPALARIRRLEFSHASFGTDAAESLGISQCAGALAELAFEYNSITVDALETLVRSPLFPRLTALELRSSAIPPALLVDALAAAREHGALARLSLANNRISHYDTAHLFALPVLRDLEWLDLADNPLNSEGVQTLAESGIVRGVRVLKLAKTLPGVPGVRALAETGALAGVRSLDLSANRLGPVAVKLLAGASSARGLRILNLANNHVGDSGAIALAESPVLSGLHELDLADSELTDAGAMALAEAPHLVNLLRLNLTAHAVTTRPFGDAARKALIERFGKRVSL